MRRLKDGCSYTGTGKMLFRHIVLFTVSMLAVMLICCCADNYCVSFQDRWNVSVFVICFGCLPLLGLVLLWRYRPARWYALTAVVIAIVFSFWRYYCKITIVDTDVENYLADESDFTGVAELVLPGWSELEQGESVSYCRTKGNAVLGYEVIELVIVYPQKVFLEKTEARVFVTPLPWRESNTWQPTANARSVVLSLIFCMRTRI